MTVVVGYRTPIRKVVRAQFAVKACIRHFLLFLIPAFTAPVHAETGNEADAKPNILLITPEKVATIRPFLKLNSLLSFVYA